MNSVTTIARHDVRLRLQSRSAGIVSMGSTCPFDPYNPEEQAGRASNLKRAKTGMNVS